MALKVTFAFAAEIIRIRAVTMLCREIHSVKKSNTRAQIQCINNQIQPSYEAYFCTILF